jgi:hypothetical protein
VDQLNKHAAGRRGRMHVRAQEPRCQAVWKAICALHDEVHIPDGSFRGIDTEKPEMNLASDTSGHSKVPGMMGHVSPQAMGDLVIRQEGFKVPCHRIGLGNQTSEELVEKAVVIELVGLWR